jgi:hypothetical protein
MSEVLEVWVELSDRLGIVTNLIALYVLIKKLVLLLECQYVEVCRVGSSNG